MQLKFKKLSEDAVLPVKAHATDAGLDLTATVITTQINECGQLMLVYHTGLAAEIPEGYVGLLFPRSSVYKKSLAQTNSVGVIDAGYRGEIMAVFKVTTDVIPAVYKQGERFAQLVIVPIPEIEVVVDNQILLEQMNGIKGRIRATMAKALHNGNINIQLRMARGDEIKPVLTRKELFDEMRQNNKAIDKMCQLLNMELA